MRKCTDYTLGQTIIKKEYDDNPDTTYLGEYTNKYQPGCIIRADRTFYEDHIDDDEYDPPGMNREYSFFMPAEIEEEPGTELYKKYALQNYDAIEGLSNSDWIYVGVTVSTVVHANVAGVSLSDTVSDSLWGIEDHWDKSSSEDINEIISELKYGVKQRLLKMGFSDNEIEESFKNAEMVGF